MPRLMGGARSTYLLLSGITAPRSVKLAQGIELLPFDQGSSPRDFLSGLDLLDRQFALLALPWVQSQLRVSGRGGKDVRLRAWNALWDVLLLSAVYAVPINCGLQSSTALERFTKRSRLNVIHYRFFEPPQDEGLALEESDCRWLETHFGGAQNLLHDHRFQNAVHCLATYRWHTMPRAQLALLWAGIEGLFAVDSEIAFRVSLYTAKFLAPGNADMQRETFAAVKRLYGIRSKAVHGAKLKGEPSESVKESAILLGSLVRTCIEREQLPIVDELVL